MHAVVVRVTINDAERGEAMLREEVIPRVSQAPGFVAGYWTRSDNSGMSMIVVEAEDTASSIAQMLESGEGLNDAVSLEGVEVREVVASA